MRIENSKGRNSRSFTESYYRLVMDKLRSLAAGRKKTFSDFSICRLYELWVDPNTGVDYLVKHGTLRRIIPLESMFDTVYSAHMATNHGGRDRMHRYIKNLYYNVTNKHLSIFTAYCETCRASKRSADRDEDDLFL